VNIKNSFIFVYNWCDKEAGKAARKKIKEKFGGKAI